MIILMKCLRCQANIVVKYRRKYCTDRCSKLYLKSQYRKRKRDKLNAYNREYRRARNSGNRQPRVPAKLRDDKCLYCSSIEDLQVAHIKPLWAGGRHKWVVTLCRKHHYEFDNLLREWWQGAIV